MYSIIIHVCDVCTAQSAGIVRVQLRSLDTVSYNTVRFLSPEHSLQYNVCTVSYVLYILSSTVLSSVVPNPKRRRGWPTEKTRTQTKRLRPSLSWAVQMKQVLLSKYQIPHNQRWDVAKRDMWDPVLTCSFCLLACIKGVRIGVKSIQV